MLVQDSTSWAIKPIGSWLLHGSLHEDARNSQLPDGLIAQRVEH